jgi:hypothetical protein
MLPLHRSHECFVHPDDRPVGPAGDVGMSLNLPRSSPAQNTRRRARRSHRRCVVIGSLDGPNQLRRRLRGQHIATLSHRSWREGDVVDNR